MKHVKADACTYIVTMLLQRLEENHPGLIAEMVEGVMADQAATCNNISDSEHVQAVFKETLNMLNRAKSG